MTNETNDEEEQERDVKYTGAADSGWDDDEIFYFNDLLDELQEEGEITEAARERLLEWVDMD